MTKVYSPLGQSRAVPVVDINPIPDLTTGSVIVLDNSKHNFGALMEELHLRLSAEIPELRWEYLRKPGAAMPVASEVLDEIVRDAAVVLTGSADCGSCTSWSTHDAVTLEMSGTPTILFSTTPFVPLARAIATSMGASGLRVVEVDHPLGGVDRVEVGERAAGIESAVLRLLLRKDSPAPDLISS
jgi:hypothetical protein